MDAETFERDLRELTAKLTAVRPADPKSRLGDVIQHMGRTKLLLQRKKDDDFAIAESIDISDAARDYLNVLQTEKLSQCRLCYHSDAAKRCAFHAKYIFTKNPKEHPDEYVRFLNSDMGIISFVELYYSYLSVPFWKVASLMMMRDLTGFSSVRELLTFYNYECDDDADEVPFETMDCDE
ncbi:ac34-like protein [Peridroma alphabaculovirus]|uniref:Ac34-like protein n=1 Tax=Peridroma alphabaculovirus TaxID=1346829 RepID=A0A068LRS8_9ABAC|nr:ac34-like protein [Peridroma alphabaculovirus]AIE47850.1 ac34-like protein [Peridroma alphabaculovirus]